MFNRTIYCFILILIFTAIYLPYCRAESPLNVTTPLNVTMICCGAYRDYVLLDNGTVWTWGITVVGRSEELLPHMLLGVSNVTMISAGENLYMLKDDGTVWEYDGYTNVTDAPGLKGIVSISGWGSNLMALSKGGEVWTLGSNYYGELGNRTNYDTLTDVTSPVKADISDVGQVHSGYQYSMALKNDGSPWGWGLNMYGQLGDGNCTFMLEKRGGYTPLRSEYFNDVATLSCGSNFVVALLKNGTVWIWGGNNNKGQRGDGSDMKISVLNPYPTRVKDLTSVKSITAGSDHVLALKEDGTVWAWGYNGKGAVGDGTTENRNVPVKIETLDHITAISAYASQNMALDEQGNVWTWGLGTTGQLGDGISKPEHFSPTPEKVSFEACNLPPEEEDASPSPEPTPGFGLTMLLEAVLIIALVNGIHGTRK